MVLAEYASKITAGEEHGPRSIMTLDAWFLQIATVINDHSQREIPHIYILYLPHQNAAQ
jgi:hypothetical protein